jgi:hypothetical protein
MRKTSEFSALETVPFAALDAVCHVFFMVISKCYRLSSDPLLRVISQSSLILMCSHARIHGQGFWGACLLYLFCPVLTCIFASDTRRAIRTKYSEFCIYLMINGSISRFQDVKKNLCIAPHRPPRGALQVGLNPCIFIIDPSSV